PGFQSRFFVLANENRTQDAGHALLRQGRNPKVRKNSGVIVRQVAEPFENEREASDFANDLSMRMIADEEG
ncbi:hypothetical protein, partial [Bifidobacterium adolescentis]|uniref:hypothetical protein n=1 Tax=Bifidobacterium adolescentis TaxID=1680 RepID=UPI001CA89994